MTEWKKKLLREFYLCTRLKVYFFDRYDNVLYQYPQIENEVLEKRSMKAAAKALEKLTQSRECQKSYAVVSFGKHLDLFCTACYFDESLPELGRVVFGPYTHNAQKAENFPFMPAFAVPQTVGFLRSFIKEYSHKNEMYELFDQNTSYHFVKIAQFVEKNVNKNISLSVIANELSLSKPYVCSIVKQTTGYTVSQFVAKVKINKAKILFWNGFTDIHEISLILGYKSQSYFSRQFKAFEGVAPTTYVQNFKSGINVKQKYL